MKKLFLLMVLTLFLVGCSGDFSGNFELSYNESEDEDVPEETVPEEPVPEDRTLGDENAPVVFVEYSSFTSPFSASFNQDTLGDILDHFVESGDVLYVYKHFHMNDLDVEAANAAECAGDQGQFFEYKDAIYDSQDSIGQPGFFEGIAESLGLDMNSWQSCVDEVRYDQKISEDRNEAIQAGIQGTPEFLVNGENSISGSQSFDAFRDVINEELGVPEETVPEESFDLKLAILNEGGFVEFGGNEIIVESINSEELVLNIDGVSLPVENGYYVNRGDLFIHYAEVVDYMQNEYAFALTEGESKNVLGFDVGIDRFASDAARVSVGDNSVRVISIDETVSFGNLNLFDVTLLNIVRVNDLIDEFEYLEGYDFNYEDQALLDVKTPSSSHSLSLGEGDFAELFGEEFELIRTSETSVRVRVGDEIRTLRLNETVSVLDFDITVEGIFFLEGGHDMNEVDLFIEYIPSTSRGNFHALLILAEGDVSDLSVDSRDSSLPNLPERCSVDPSFACLEYVLLDRSDDGEFSGELNFVLTNQVGQTIEEFEVTDIKFKGDSVGYACDLDSSMPISSGSELVVLCEVSDDVLSPVGEKESVQVEIEYRAQGQQLARTITVDLFATVQ